MQGGAGQGVHMPKPKFSIKTEVLGGGGVQWQWQWQRLRLTAPPPPLCFPVDAFLLTVLPGGLLAREVLYYALCGAISAAKGHQGACKYSSCPCPVRSAEGCRAVQGGAGQGVHMPKPPRETPQNLRNHVGAPMRSGTKRKRKTEVATAEPIDPDQWIRDARGADDDEAVVWFARRATNTAQDEPTKETSAPQR